VFAGLLHRAHRRFQITRIVQGIEHTEDIDARARSQIDKGLDHVVGVVPVTEQVLTTQKHLLTGMRHCGLELAQAFPRIFVQEADTGIECGATPRFKGPEPDPVHAAGDWKHVCRLHSGGKEGLVAVPQGQVGYLDTWHTLLPPLFPFSEPVQCGGYGGCAPVPGERITGVLRDILYWCPFHGVYDSGGNFQGEDQQGKEDENERHSQHHDRKSLAKEFHVGPVKPSSLPETQ